MSERTTQRVVVITGGSSGIGASTAEHFRRKGWRIGLIARGAGGLETTRAVLAEAGATVSIAQADVTDCEALREAAAQFATELGPIDVWINNAGVGVFSSFVEMTEAEFRRVTEVNYFGVVNGTRVALEHMRPRNAGVIVNICSAIGLCGVPLQTAYSGSKWAMRGFAEALRAELLRERSRVHLTTVYPPSVNTPFYRHAISRVQGAPRPPPPVYQPEIVADAIYFAATNRRRDVLVGGQTVQIALLNAVAPAFTETLLALFGPATQTSTRPGLREQQDENVFEPSRHPAGSHGSFDRGGDVQAVSSCGPRNTEPALPPAGLTAMAIGLLGRRR